MFSLSAKGVYGLTALMDLGANRSKGSVQIRDVADRNGIPQHYLEQILVALKKAGYVESYRGAQGGYALARDPDTISVTEVLAQLEGRLEVVSDSRKEGVLSFFWSDLQQTLEDALGKSLGDLLREKALRDRRADYVI